MPLITDPPAIASSSVQRPLVYGQKRRKQGHPSPPKASKTLKPDYYADVEEANCATPEETNDFDLEGAIPEGFILQTEPSHTQRRQREANAWQELMPSLIYPLMTAFHAVTENITNGVVEVETFRCSSGCLIQRNTVNIVSFGGW